MDHGVWPCFTILFYIHQTGDVPFLLERASYFKDGQMQNTRSGQVYMGSLLEHILIQTLMPFFNVGDHNMMKLQDADWNDGLDMAGENGESVAFTAMYAGNMDALAQVLEAAKERWGWQEVEFAEEILLLIDRAGKKVNYGSVADKRTRLAEYLEATAKGPSGKLASVPLPLLVADLREKAQSIKQHLNAQEWIEEKGGGWFNGYYDNKGRRVEGPQPDGSVRMTLTGQVFPILAGLVDKERVPAIIKAVEHHLFDKHLGGFRLNTDFKTLQPALGRAF
jgi:cellobiose phosphorylase